MSSQVSFATQALNTTTLTCTLQYVMFLRGEALENAVCMKRSVVLLKWVPSHLVVSAAARLNFVSSEVKTGNKV